MPFRGAYAPAVSTTMAKVAWMDWSFDLGNVPALVAPSLLILYRFLLTIPDTSVLLTFRPTVLLHRFPVSWLARTAKCGS